jgi:hypothetical protein
VLAQSVIGCVTSAQDGAGERCPSRDASHLGHDDTMCRLGNTLMKILNNFQGHINYGVLMSTARGSSSLF